jgi:hypothetical protein
MHRGTRTVAPLALAVSAILFIVLVVSTALLFPIPSRAGENSPRKPRAGETAAREIPPEPFAMHADLANEWSPPGQQVRVWLLQGQPCRIMHGDTTIEARRMVVWVGAEKHGRRRVQVYAEDDVRFETPEGTRSESTFIREFVTEGGVTITAPTRTPIENATELEENPLYQRAQGRREGARATGKTTQASAPTLFDPSKPRASATAPGEAGAPVRRVRVFQRSAIPYNIYSTESTRSTPPEQVWILTGGVNLVIDGDSRVGTVDLSADAMVIWTQTAASGFSDETLQSNDTPLQVYMEGNIVGRQGGTLIKANRAFYDAREKRALMLDAELRMHLPQLPNDVRVKAKKLRQLSEKSFHAEDAWASGSQFGKPSYRLQASDLYFQEKPDNPWFGGRITKQPEDPLAEGAGGAGDGEGEDEDDVATTPWATAVNSTVYLNDAPVFYWPYMSGAANDSSPMPFKRISFGSDRVFGQQFYSTWNLFKIFGAQTPDNTRLDLLADYYSERGPGVGLSGDYAGSLFNLPGDHWGTALGYYVHDTGTDNLGLDRRNLTPNTQNRGRILYRQRSELPLGFTFTKELGWQSDRNFMEQYFTNEWNTGKDNENVAYLKQQQSNWAWSVLMRDDANTFSTNTKWLPRADMYMLSEPIFNNWLTWSSHTYAGYAQIQQVATPSTPADIYTPLPYMPTVQGGVLSTQQEIDAPFNVGALKLVPYVMGQGNYWEQDINGNPLGRLWGSAGIRGSISAQKAMPDVNSEILGLRGLNHKMVFDFDLYDAQSNQPLSLIPSYNEFDDQAQLRFRNRLLTDTFGGTLPPQFDPRFFAVRSGAAYDVTSPYNELVASQEALRLGWRHRLQTKVGPYENPRIVDWMTLDLDATFFPNANRDNFGQHWGLLTGRYNWNMSERTTFFANALYDLYPGAEQLWSAGVVSQRTQRGSVYLGVRQIKGAGLDSEILTASYSYQMSPKWMTTVGTAYDIAEQRNRGQSLMLTRVGADFLFHLRATFDQSKNNAGIMFSIEPKLFANPAMGAAQQYGPLF